MNALNLDAEEAKPVLSFECHDSDNSVFHVVDHVDRKQCVIHIDKNACPEPISTNDFHNPVDKGVKLSTGYLQVRHPMQVLIRNSVGKLVANLSNGDSQDLPHDTYRIELSAPIKMYVVVESTLSVEVTPEDAHLEFTRDSDVKIGAHSHHKKPAATIAKTLVLAPAHSLGLRYYPWPEPELGVLGFH